MIGSAKVLEVNMQRVMRISLVAVVAGSLIWVLYQVIRPMVFSPQPYSCGFLADGGVVLRDATGTEVGYLKKGAVFYAPSMFDMHVTDPGDNQLHKVYVRLTPEVMKHLILLPAKLGTQGVPETMCTVMDASLSHK
jgi:hypothetical protein